MFRKRPLFIILSPLFLSAFCTHMVCGGIIVNRNTDTSGMTAQDCAEAAETLHIVYFDTAPGLGLACADSSTVIDGTRFSCTQGGFGSSLHLVVHRFSQRAKNLVNRGNISWETLIRSFLDNPARKKFNIIVCPGSPPAGTSADTATEEYLQFMSRLTSRYPGKMFVYMTGALDNRRIRTYCRSGSRALYDYADFSGSRAKAEWYLWTRLAEDSRGPQKEDPAVYSAAKTFIQLVKEGKLADKKNNRAAAYTSFKRALHLAEESPDIRRMYAKEIITIRSRVSSLGFHSDVRKEKEAWEAYERSAAEIRKLLERARRLAEDTGNRYPDTRTGRQAKALSRDIRRLQEQLQ